MARKPGRGRGEPLPISNLYIVEVKNSQETKYVICEKLMVVDHGGGDVPWADVDAYLAEHPLRAAPISDYEAAGGRGKGGWGATASTFTSADMVGVTINIFPPKDRGE